MSDTKKYSKEHIDTLLKSFEIYLLNPKDVKNADNMRKYVKDYESKHTDLFVQSVEMGTDDIKAFAEGRLEISPDAILSMEKYIETFGKEQIDGKYQYTPEALKALEKIKDLKKQELTKSKAEKSFNSAHKAEKSFNSFLLAKHEIEHNSRMSDAQKAKEIEKLTSAARQKMQSSKNLSDDDLKVAPLFIAAFGYDKGNALNKIARDFKNKVEKNLAEKTPVAPKKSQETPSVENTSATSEITQEKAAENVSVKKEKKSFWQKVKNGVAKTANIVKRSFKYWLPVFAVAGVSGNLEVIKADKTNINDNNDDAKHKKEIVEAKQSQQEVEQNKDLDISLLTQCAKRLGFQNKISAKEATKLTMETLKNFSKLSKTTKAKIAGKTDLEKLSKLVVVRGDQPKLKQDIDNFIQGEKVAPDILKDIAARTTKVTDDFSANKDNALNTPRQSLDMSAYLFVKDRTNS